MLKNIIPVSGQNDEVFGHEPFRPQFHFTPRKNWMNDPNGLVYFEGEYHLFFQYNPHGVEWGHMSWGHAVSTDLIHWLELPIAMPECEFMIFSGCALVDWTNVTNLGDGTAPPLLAFYTAHDGERLNQSQHLAFSQDRGRSWTHYAGNPLIDLDIEHFRDPNIFFHAESEAWIMVVALAQLHKLQIYRSTNLLDWTLASEFGPAGSRSGQWECPDLMQIPVAGSHDESHWVLKVDVDKDFISGGSGAQYFIGDFDGFHFLVDKDNGSLGGDFVDYGPDFYAAISWSDLPAEQPLPVWIGWQSNHQTGKDYPTSPWRGAQSIARQLFLFEEAGRLRLGQRPVAALEAIRQASQAHPSHILADQELLIIPAPTSSFEMAAKLEYESKAVIEIRLADDDGDLLSVSFNNDAGNIAFARFPSRNAPTDAFARAVMAPMANHEATEIQLLFDGSLVEIFIDGGRRVYSACVFPHGDIKLTFASKAGSTQLSELALWSMNQAIDY